MTRARVERVGAAGAGRLVTVVAAAVAVVASLVVVACDASVGSASPPLGVDASADAAGRSFDPATYSTDCVVAADCLAAVAIHACFSCGCPTAINATARAELDAVEAECAATGGRGSCFIGCPAQTVACVASRCTVTDGGATDASATD